MAQTWETKKYDKIVVVIALLLLLMGAIYIYHEDHRCRGEYTTCGDERGND